VLPDREPALGLLGNRSRKLILSTLEGGDC
jgi:hypothetical protein